MTSAIVVFYQLSYQANWELVEHADRSEIYENIHI